MWLLRFRYNTHARSRVRHGGTRYTDRGHGLFASPVCSATLQGRRNGLAVDCFNQREKRSCRFTLKPRLEIFLDETPCLFLIFFAPQPTAWSLLWLSPANVIILQQGGLRSLFALFDSAPGIFRPGLSQETPRAPPLLTADLPNPTQCAVCPPGSPEPTTWRSHPTGFPPLFLDLHGHDNEYFYTPKTQAQCAFFIPSSPIRPRLHRCQSLG